MNNHHKPLIAQLRAAIDAGLVEIFELVAQVGDAGRGARQVAGFAGEVFARMGFERHHGRFQAEPRGGAAHVGQQGLVAAMDAVEIADREFKRFQLRTAKEEF